MRLVAIPERATARCAGTRVWRVSPPAMSSWPLPI
jgi:hypothetical protein